ncbi:MULTISPECIES: hypothetical protein [unclassified Sporosarcina]|uniref:hypothetical protein n=1 Tax=unclassified Sporosarcina TaxID=2647733 RepID=UPI001A931D31|nr:MULTISPECIES: hypothetical protein [unclassified Sporosarcina]MBO0587584.1 hypothetical protein [Sporosarcina sp. E16_8]MBO0602428.1 hypothetical protein [Sporosarcina sp. E16_3]
MKQKFLTRAITFFQIAGALLLIDATRLLFGGSEKISSEGVFAFSVSIFSLSMALTLAILKMQDNFSSHQAIGGYLPSRELDGVIHDWYIHRYRLTGIKKAHGLKRPAKYTKSEKDAKRLISLLPEHDGSCKKNKARGSYTCTYIYRGKKFTATSASREMAICIAFLRSCDYPDV